MAEYDVIIRGGVIVDGTGSPPFRADVGIKGGIIAKLGDLSGERAEHIIDAEGLVVAPGFIDIHNHSDVDLFLVPTADNYVLQGVTTLVVGNCGLSAAPLEGEAKRLFKAWFKRFLEKRGWPQWSKFGEYLDELEKLEKSVNVAVLVGHGTVRAAVVGLEDREPSERELKEMEELVAEAVASGAFGLSTGLIYVPGMYARTEELVRLAKVVAKRGGIYASHIRGEGVGLLDALHEALRVGVESGAGVEISHLKAAGPAAWGLVDAALAVMESYVARGYDVSADAYPYTASSTALEALLPSWARKGGLESLLNLLRSPEELQRLEEFVEKRGLMEERFLDWDAVVVARSESHPEVEGRSIREVAEAWNTTPLRAAARLLLDDKGTTAVVVHSMSERDVERVITHPLVAIGSDGSVKEYGVGKPHPRSYGTFPRVIAKYVREKKLMSLPEAVRKMTSLPARKLGLWDRGVIRPGFKADIVVFNYYTIRDTATYENPHSYPRGVEYVLVNGVLVVEDGKHTGAKPGRVLRRA